MRIFQVFQMPDEIIQSFLIQMYFQTIALGDPFQR